MQERRSEKERELPSYCWPELDMARAGYDIYGRPLTPEEIRQVFAKHGLEWNAPS